MSAEEMTTQPTDDDLPAVLEAFLDGDERALAQVYARWSPLVYSVALRTLGQVSEAEMITEQVFTAAWTLRQSFDPSRTRLPAWLIDIAEVKIAESIGDRVHQWGRADLTELVERLMLADEIARLDPGPRQLLQLALFEGLTHTEIGDRLHLSADVVRTRIRETLTALRERLEVKTDAH